MLCDIAYNSIIYLRIVAAARKASGPEDDDDIENYLATLKQTEKIENVAELQRQIKDCKKVSRNATNCRGIYIYFLVCLVILVIFIFSSFYS